MKKIRRCTRIVILSLLVVSVFIPICILSEKLKLINVNGLYILVVSNFNCDLNV